MTRMVVLNKGESVVVFNVLFETDYENEDVHSAIETFATREDAVGCLERAIADETLEGRYTEEEVEERLVRDGDDHFCFYKDGSKTNWKFRGTIYKNKVK